ncbi:hypothetical protein BRADI_3g35956v3 [Brachypodium distachyon]|uniref:Uncharacterized protein n=1 Tax=Brachypodium distachyon TaxID=15368 RepID=A0A2K2D1G3_BRADI|nr:hypothetical protein BRADI_3g35956v3 [Brachypodium distachyon]
MTFAQAQGAIPASALKLKAFAAPINAFIFMCYVMLWGGSAGAFVKVFASRAMGEGSPVLPAASLVMHNSYRSGILLAPVGMMLLGARGMLSVSDKTLAKKDVNLIGALISVPFLMLISVNLVVGQSPVEGSGGERIGSVLFDVGLLGVSATQCFIVLPTKLLREWRMEW